MAGRGRRACRRAGCWKPLGKRGFRSDYLQRNCIGNATLAFTRAPAGASPALPRRMKLSVTYIIGFTVRPDQRERFLSLLNGVLDAMRHESMFVSADFHQDPERSLPFSAARNMGRPSECHRRAGQASLPRGMARGSRRSSGSSARHRGLATAEERWPPQTGRVRTGSNSAPASILPRAAVRSSRMSRGRAHSAG